MKIERTRIHFFSNVFSAVAVLGSQGPRYRRLRDGTRGYKLEDIILLFPITLVCEKNNVLHKWGKEERAGSVHWLLRCCVSSVKEAHCFKPYPGTKKRFAKRSNNQRSGSDFAWFCPCFLGWFWPRDINLTLGLLPPRRHVV